MEFLTFVNPHNKNNEALVEVPPFFKGMYLLNVLEVDGKKVTVETEIRMNGSLERFLARIEEDQPKLAKKGFNLLITRSGSGIRTKYKYEVIK